VPPILPPLGEEMEQKVLPKHNFETTVATALEEELQEVVGGLAFGQVVFSSTSLP
jgi:hypothetical protein